ncbi:MAG: transglutaminase domain-containing protein [Saprospiraceae bacterium]
MNQILNTLLLLLWAVSAMAQSEFSTIDSFAQTARKSDFPSPDALAKALCKDLKNDRDKARILFSWIAENIRYDLNAVGKNGPDANSKKEYEAKLVKQVYRKGKGVCMHYALLYKSMADAVGLECTFIGGHSKGSLRGGWASHAWNAVKIQGKWELLDVTWGAGYFDDDGKKFRQVFQPGFFLPSPRIFALNHFPDDEKWQLLEVPINKATFKKQSAFSYGNPNEGITDSEPLGLPLTKNTDGKFELKLKMKKTPPIIKLVMGGREIDFEQSESNGWTIFRFSASHGREIEIWGGKKTGRAIHTSLMGIFSVK